MRNLVMDREDPPGGCLRPCRTPDTCLQVCIHDNVTSRPSICTRFSGNIIEPNITHGEGEGRGEWACIRTEVYLPDASHIVLTLGGSEGSSAAYVVGKKAPMCY